MLQIVLKERSAHLASFTLFTRDVDQYKKRHFHNSISHQEHLLHRTLITSYFRPANIAKILRKLCYRTPPEVVVSRCSSK